MRNKTLRLLAPAKINLHLRVGPRRNDGFHPLLTWMATIGLFDTLTVNELTATQSSQEGGVAIVMTCDDPSLPCDARNLVVRAASLFHQSVSAGPGKTAGEAKSGHARFDEARAGSVLIHLEKRIPAGGGLGGGSSDAARALLGLNRLWETDKDLRWLSNQGSQLGSDVPFFLFGPSSVCKGRGESVCPIGGQPRDKWVTLVLPPIGMPTPDVYRRFDELGLGIDKDVHDEPDWRLWASLDAPSLLPRLVNDLEAPAFSLRPDLGALRDDIEKTIGRAVRMSGSGSSLFTLFDAPDEAASAAEMISKKHRIRAIAVQLAPVIEDDLLAAG